MVNVTHCNIYMLRYFDSLYPSSLMSMLSEFFCRLYTQFCPVLQTGANSQKLHTGQSPAHCKRIWHRFMWGSFFYLNKKYNFTQKSILSKIFFILFSCIFTIFLVCDKKFHCLEQLAVCIQSHSYTVLLLRKEKQDFHRRRFWYTNTSNKQGGKRKWYLENCVT